MPKRTDIPSILSIGAVLAFDLALSGCGKAPAEPRRMESYEELKSAQDRDFAASPDIQLPDVRERLRALGVAEGSIARSTDDYHEPILLLTLTAAQFAKLDKPALARLEIDSRYRFRLTDPGQIKAFASFSVAEQGARDAAVARRELAEKGETDKFPRYKAGSDMTTYARALEDYCGYGPGEAFRVIDGKWLEYNNKMASDGAIAASRKQGYAPFACIRRIVYATDLGRHFIGNRGREGAVGG